MVVSGHLVRKLNNKIPYCGWRVNTNTYKNLICLARKLPQKSLPSTVWPGHSPTLLYSRSQHLTCLSSPHENRYGCLGLTTRPRTVLMWPVRDSFNVPLARSQIWEQADAKQKLLLHPGCLSSWCSVQDFHRDDYSGRRQPRVKHQSLPSELGSQSPWLIWQWVTCCWHILKNQYLDDSITRSCRKPLIARLHGNASHPAQMATNDLKNEKQVSHQLHLSTSPAVHCKFVHT